MTCNGIHDFHRHNASYGGAVGVLPLGARCALPVELPHVDLCEVLRESAPELAEQAEDPEKLLLPPPLWPDRLTRLYRRLARSYPTLVERGMSNGMMRMLPRKKIAKFRGRVLVAGGFAVPKSSVEDRFIGPLGVNELIDPQRMPRPRFAYIPALRCCCVSGTRPLLVSKRDARHYYHCLRLGRKWRPWLALPPPHGRDEEADELPVLTTARMGFGPSAGFAQAITDMATGDLDGSRRLVFGQAAPPVLPSWGSIMDDMWVLEEAPVGSELPEGPAWLDRATARWEELGVRAHPDKIVDAAVDQEIQGYMVDSEKRWLGVAHSKRR